MALITTPIPNLIGGVSQQPAAIRKPSEAQEIENAVPSPVEGLIKRPPTEHIAAIANAGGTLRTASTTQPPFVHLIERDETERYILTIQQDGTADVYDLAGNRKTLYTDGTSLGTASRSQRKALTVGDVTFIANCTTTIAAGAATVAQTPANYNRECLIWILQSNYDRTHTIKLTSGGTTTTVTHKVTGGGGNTIGTNHAAADLADKINNTATYSATTSVDNVIRVIASADFTVVLEDDFGGEGMTLIRDEVARFEDLPPTAPHGYMVKVAGTPESNVDDYYVKFDAENGSFSRGIWVECPAPGVKYQWNNATMPLILIRQADGTFYLKMVDGTTPTVGNNGPGGTAYDHYKWTERLVGDDTTNPFPTFVGLKVQEMVFHQNRLGIMAGENIVFSETSEFFNFFRTTTLDLLDTDTIDIASSSPRVGKIFAAIPFNRDLILFTPNSQMVLRGGDILSPKSVAIIPAADFENQANLIEPIPSANSIFFTYGNGNYVGVRELVPQPAIDGSYLANDLTNNVPRYIPGPPVHLAATTHDNLAVLVASDGNIYGYRYFNSGSEKIQSAWFKFTFQDSSTVTGSFAKAVWAGFVESDMYVLMMRTASNSTTGYMTIEKIRMGAGINDTAISGKNWVTTLDQRKYYAAGQGTYDANTGRTTFTLPKPMSYAAGKTTVVTLDGYILSTVAGTAFSDPTAGTVAVTGDWSNKAVWIGTAYTMTYEFSTPFLKGSAGTGSASILTGRYQLRYLTLQYADTAYFRVTVKVKNEDTYSYPFTGEVLGLAVVGTTSISTGTFRVPVYSKNDNTTIKIINDSPMPSKILSGELEAFYNDRAQRYG